MKNDQPTLSKKEVSVLLAELAQELGQSLIKTTPGQEASSEEDPDVSATAPSPAAAGSDDATPGAAGDEASAPDVGGEAPDAGQDPAQDPAADGDEGQPSVEALKAEYAKLPPDMLKMHLIAAKEALMDIMGGGDDGAGVDDGSQPGPDAGLAAPPGPDAGAGAPPPAPPGGLPPGGPPAPPEGSAPAFKSEMKSNPNGGLKKSQSDKQIEALQKKVSEQEGTLAKLVTALETFVGQPQRKAVTSFNAPVAVKKTAASFSKSEIQARLTELSKSEKTSSADRQLINGYYFGTTGVEDIGHLLTK